MGWSVERAGSGDRPRLAALARDLLPGAGLPGREARLVRDARGRAVGYLDARRVADELHVLALGVEAGARRRGAASTLLAAALGEARAAGAVVCHLEVRAGNRAARRFYARHGFGEVGRRPRYYADGEDAVLLTRILAPRAAAAR